MDPILEEAGRQGKELYKEGRKEEFLARCRRCGLLCLIVYAALMCIFKVGYGDAAGSMGAEVLSVLTLLAALYFIAGIFSLIRVFFILADDKEEKKKLGGIRAALSEKNGALIRFFKGVSFWGTVAALLCIFLLGVPREQIFATGPAPHSFREYYCGILYWAVTVFVFLVVFQFLYICFFVPHRGEDARSVPGAIRAEIRHDFVFPASAVRFKGTDGKTVVRNILLLAYFVLLIAGIFALAAG